jgi:PAS domain S-box-containing protein
LIIVVTLDISERLRSERDLRLARDNLRAVTDSLGEGMFTVDTAGQVIYMNPVAEAALGWTASELQGRDLHQVTHSHRPDGSPLPAEECPILRACQAGETVEVDDDMFIRADGTKLEVSYTAAPFSTDRDVEGCVILFRDVSVRNANRRRAALQSEKLASIKRIRTALDHDRFVLFAQPIIEIETGLVVQRELLIRMKDPDKAGALIAPGAFLPVAEEFGLIVDIDRWVIDRAADVAASGHAVEVNVSGVSIGDSRLMDHITSAIRRSGADPTLMVFEITETTLIENELAGCRFVEGVRELGCGVALDDFGTGYGGFTYLKKLPVDIVKIDMEFVRDLTVNSASQNVVEAIVNLAHRFQVLTVAEGVEDQETLELLREFGVNRARSEQRATRLSERLR